MDSCFSLQPCQARNCIHDASQRCYLPHKHSDIATPSRPPSYLLSVFSVSDHLFKIKTFVHSIFLSIEYYLQALQPSQARADVYLSFPMHAIRRALIQLGHSSELAWLNDASRRTRYFMGVWANLVFLSHLSGFRKVCLDVTEWKSETNTMTDCKNDTLILLSSPRYCLYAFIPRLHYTILNLKPPFPSRRLQDPWVFPRLTATPHQPLEPAPNRPHRPC